MATPTRAQTIKAIQHHLRNALLDRPLWAEFLAAEVRISIETFTANPYARAVVRFALPLNLRREIAMEFDVYYEVFQGEWERRREIEQVLSREVEDGLGNNWTIRMHGRIRGREEYYLRTVQVSVVGDQRLGRAEMARLKSRLPEFRDKVDARNWIRSVTNDYLAAELARANELYERGFLRENPEARGWVAVRGPGTIHDLSPEKWGRTAGAGRTSVQAQVWFAGRRGWRWRVGRGSRTATQTRHGLQKTYRIFEEGASALRQDAFDQADAAIERWVGVDDGGPKPLVKLAIGAALVTAGVQALRARRSGAA